MCVPGAYGNQKQSGGTKMASSSPGGRLDQAQRANASTSGGGTNGSTILSGTPRNSGVDALRKNTYLGV
tara:strand:+ start:585 stop:791 length:207 start_codon:yes stop_codon:yes gene_type:complete